MTFACGNICEMPHFLFSDVLGLTLALLLGTPLIVLPGFAFGWSLDLFRFRGQTAPVQWSLALLFGGSMLPVVLYLPFRLLSVNAMWAVMALLCAGGILAAARCPMLRWNEIQFATKVAVVAWITVGSLLMLDAVVGQRLYPSAVMIDQSFRAQVIASLAHADHLPPSNYFFRPGHSVVFHYHYFVFIIGAAMVRLGRGFITAHAALDALTLWIGLGLLAMIAAFMRFFGSSDRDSRAWTRTAWILLAVGGLDILPVAGIALRRWLLHEGYIIPYPDVEWWNGWSQVFSWIDTAIWQPHHLAALIGCLTGCVLLWSGRDAAGFIRWSYSVAAGLSFASAAGTSVDVTAVFTIFLLIVVIELVLNAPQYLAPVLAAGGIAALLLSPFLFDILGAKKPPSIAFGFWIREFQPRSAVLEELGVKSALLWNLGAALALPLNYFLELGVFFIGGVWWLSQWRRRECNRDYQNHLMIGLALLSIVLCSFVWSGTEISNDFGYRAILPLQFVLLVWATDFVSKHQSRLSNRSRSPLIRKLAVACIALGIATNVVDALLMRFTFGMSDAGIALHHNTLRTPDPPRTFFDLRTSYSWIRNHSPKNAVVQENPESWQTLAQGEYSERGTAIYSSMPSFAGGTSVELDATSLSVNRLFSRGTNTAAMQSLCKRFGIDYIVVQEGDPAWGDRSSYVWHEDPVLNLPTVRTFECRNERASQTDSQF